MSKQKGDKRERQARRLLQRGGYLVETPNYQKYSNIDFFNMFDLMATRSDRPLRLIQVKSNKAAGIRAYANQAAAWFDLDHTDVELWICHDRQGWRVLDVRERADGAGATYTTILDERDHACNMGEAVVEWLLPNAG